MTNTTNMTDTTTMTATERVARMDVAKATSNIEALKVYIAREEREPKPDQYYINKWEQMLRDECEVLRRAQDRLAQAQAAQADLALAQAEAQTQAEALALISTATETLQALDTMAGTPAKACARDSVLLAMQYAVAALALTQVQDRARLIQATREALHKASVWLDSWL